MDQITREPFSFDSGGYRLEGVIHRGPLPCKAAAFVAHPHPHFGGDMDNPVVRAISRGLAGAGVLVCRFNFAGVGRSQGISNADGSETAQARDAIREMTSQNGAAHLPKLACGYSFGAWIALKYALEFPGETHSLFLAAPPIGMFDMSFSLSLSRHVYAIAGENDNFAPADSLRSWAGKMRTFDLEILPDVDHFFSSNLAVGKVEEAALRFATKLE